MNRQIGSLENRIENAKTEKQQIHKDITKLAKQNQQTAIYAKRITLCESIQDTLESDMAEEEDRARKVLRTWIGELLGATTHKVLTLHMTDDYVISPR